MDSWIGIDYGSKMAGTTAICFFENERLKILQSEKKKDADSFIASFFKNRDILQVFLDAPLSLPSSLITKKGDSYFYRLCDRELGAMSPMFLGGLTARAIRLSTQLSCKYDVTFYETYPGALVRQTDSIAAHYGKKVKFNQDAVDALQAMLPYKADTIQNWHQYDAVLAWYSGYRFHKGIHKTYGNKEEGQIIV